jgi:hypothetical protein
MRLCGSAAPITEGPSFVQEMLGAWDQNSNNNNGLAESKAPRLRPIVGGW